jgi:hypothetical protein
LRWWDGNRWHDLTLPGRDATKRQKHAIRDGRATSPLVGLKSIGAGTWCAIGAGVYLLAAFLIAVAITKQEGTGFAMNLLVSLVGLALLLIAFVLPVALVGGLVAWFVYAFIRDQTGGWEKWRETRRANRAARTLGLPTQRQARKTKQRADRVERARRG